MRRVSGEVVLSKGKLGFQDVLDRFPHATEIWICTFNLPKAGALLLRALKDLPEGVKVNVVCSIPGRWESYYNADSRKRAAVEIRRYTGLLDPSKFDASVRTFFNFQNHAKFVATQDIAYLGSANFSDESADNFEAGLLVTDTEAIQALVNEVFEPIRQASVEWLGKAGDGLLVQLHQTRQALDAIGEDLNTSFYSEPEWPAMGATEFVVPDAAPPVLSAIRRVVDDLGDLRQLDDLGATVMEVVSKHLQPDALVALEASCSDQSVLGRYLRFDVTSSVVKSIDGDIDAYDENLDLAIDSATDRALEEFDKIVEKLTDSDVQVLISASHAVKAQVYSLLQELTRLQTAAHDVDNT